MLYLEFGTLTAELDFRQKHKGKCAEKLIASRKGLSNAFLPRLYPRVLREALSRRLAAFG
jgi:hypothetical protein